MKIELKNVKFSEHMSEETNAFTATVYVDGKRCGDAKNEGCGGNTWVRSFPDTRDLFKQAEDYCKSLPDTTHECEGMEPFTMKSDLESVVDNLFEQWLNDRNKKKFEKKMLTCLMWGTPNRYSYINFKTPLNHIDRMTIQRYIDKYKPTLKEGEKFLNTNLVGFNW